ncbi:hypothetical protein A3Q34_05935 [Colwellia sp. PAMC 20917]|jgi:hypothetical protein|uniref:DUF4202 domain-containing protein n=1 Tax=unclassified Colwellia TaxID=196834 RepID=UPI000879146E|nr:MULTISPECIES: DUF4202 domain-containing protein [unclassified Colwellia]AOW76439.1 hypothetical protein A3Q34_05935 [Colwellia sp. PAMC 20917]MBA6349422.1 DUF4202 domain-containing protein [Colwellia sp. BRX8-9]MBA6353551.1 DUF4202 domain-containing protein [Colwellia sp. BRX9-1]MBA6385059.1 DUF4202 domain-containing protein [Colwellia sp. BRX10-9]MBA6395767.1 DUF4202 domain-containing protein [Colwellia sp. BRX10-6]
MTSSRLTAVLCAIDKINSEDPNQTLVNGHPQANELLYGQYMTSCLEQYFPQSNELLQIAVRAQHIKRWDLKRTEFDEGKAGYYQWRISQGKFHAELTKSLMLENDYSEHEAELTACILRKEQLKTNANTQTLEDVACLVFLQYYFDAFAAKYTEADNEAKIIRIVKKTWGKMSARGHEIALSLTLPNHLATLVGKALAD